MNILTKYIFVLSVLLFSIPLRMEAVMRTHHITTAEGLSSNYISDVVQDEQGFIWLASTGGMSRYDGNNIVNFHQIPYINTERLISTSIQRIFPDHSKRYLWARSINYTFFCYDTKNGDFIDYVGKDKKIKTFREVRFSQDGTAWLFQGDGVRRVTFTYPNGKDNKPEVHTQDYTSDKGELPGAEVRKLNCTTEGGAWLTTDKGLGYISKQGKASIAVKDKKVYQAIKIGEKYVFLIQGNEVVVGNGLGKIEKRFTIPSPIGIVNRIPGYVIYKPQAPTDHHHPSPTTHNPNIIYAFTNCGTILIDIANGTVSKSDKLSCDEGKNFGRFFGYTTVISRNGEMWIIDSLCNVVANQQIIPLEYITSFAKSFSVKGNSTGQIFISTLGNGNFCFDTKTKTLTRFASDDDSSLLNSDDITMLYVDGANNVWASTEGDGLYCVSQNRDFSNKYVRIAPDNLKSIENEIKKVIPIGDGTYLITNSTGKEFIFNPSTEQLVSGAPQEVLEMIRDYPEYVLEVYSRCKDAYGNIWIGTRERGIFINGKRYFGKEYSIDYMFRDPCGRVWFTIRDSGLRIAKSQKAYKDEIIKDNFLEEDAGEKCINDMILDKEGRVWLATGKGLYIADSKEKKITKDSFHLFDSENSIVPTGELECITIDLKDHILWCGLKCGGVLECTFNDDYTKIVDCQSFTMKNGLPSNAITDIEMDKNGNVWVGTENGISVIYHEAGNIRTFRFGTTNKENYIISDGITFLPDGKVLCGTRCGLLLITPEQHTSPNAHQPKVPQLTDIQIAGVSVFADYSDESLSEVRYQLLRNDEVTLSYKQNDLTFCFSNMNYAEAKTFAYQFYLEGADKDWRPVTNVPQVNYSDLSDGHYTLHVKSLTGNKWSEEKTIDIRITPPWYASWWAYLIYICILVAIGTYVYKQVRDNYQLRQHVKKEKQERELQAQLIDYKVRFFTNVSHEFRTPLTIISGTVERIKQINQQSNLKQPISTLTRSTDRMLRLVNQLLEFRKMQQGKLSLAVQNADIIAFIQNIYMDFHETAETENITYDFRTSASSLVAPFDTNFLNKIFYNLISNAFKYTPRHGSVQISIKTEADKIRISIADTGVGVAENMREHLFDRYMESSRVVKDSLGIGLTLTAELVRKHHGEISYEANTPQGSIFTVTLPVTKEAYSEEEYLANSVLTEDEGTIEKQGFEQTYREMKSEPLNDASVLIVEDDADMASFIAQNLCNYFHCIIAKNGVDALSQLEGREKLPELIVTDVQMPEMDGFTLVGKLRKDKRYRNVPIIILTALTQKDKYLKGIKQGADLYLAKPFSPSVLIAHALQLIGRRYTALATESASANNNATVIPASAEAQSVTPIADIRDKNFLRQLDSVIMKHIGDENLGVEMLTDELAMGRTKLFEKVKQILDTTPRDYILKHRMDYAVQLMRDENLTIAEIAYKTGFGHPPYFTRVFKKYFGVTPSEYIKG